MSKPRYRIKWVKTTAGIQQEYHGEWETDRAQVEGWLAGVKSRFPECNPELETEATNDKAFL